MKTFEDQDDRLITAYEISLKLADEEKAKITFLRIAQCIFGYPVHPSLANKASKITSPGFKEWGSISLKRNGLEVKVKVSCSGTIYNVRSNLALQIFVDLQTQYQNHCPTLPVHNPHLTKKSSGVK